MNKILLTLVYFGSWPRWFPAFLASCVANRDIDWLFVTDCPCEGMSAGNLRIVPMELAEFNRRATQAIGIDIRKNPYSQLDLRPAYGKIFAEYYQGYDFWGHVDADVIWGRIRHFVSDEKLSACDIFSSRQEAFAGHFTLYRNVPAVNTLFQLKKNWQQAMSAENYQHFDEKMMGILVKYCLPKELRGSFRLEWSEALVLDWWPLYRRRHGWQWRQGVLTDGKGVEQMYIHFMTWKPYMKHIDFQTGETPESFQISHRGIWSQPMNWKERMALHFSPAFTIKSWLRYLAWYGVDRSRWLSWLRPKQHARRNPVATN